MATIQSQLVCDCSTLANFKQWAQGISSAFSTFGWAQSSDTGQVNWSTISTVPGSGAYVYEIWQPNDGLQTFYLKVEYGNTSGGNSPGLRLTVSSSTNGAGTATGFIVGPVVTQGNGITAPSTTTQYECDFSGAPGRIGAMMWRNGTNNCQQLFAVERSINSSGSYTSSYVTLWTWGTNSFTASGSQQSLVFGVGVGPNMPNGTTFGNGGGGVTSVRFGKSGATGWTGAFSAAFNGAIPFDTCAPSVGFFDNPCTMIGAGLQGDFTEGVTFAVTLYGSTRTYMPSKNGPFGTGFGVNQNSGAVPASALCMRFD